MKNSLLVLIIVLFVQSVSGQEWTEELTKKDANFYDIQRAFNQYWETHDKTEKSRGYKVFKRWEYRVEPRVYPSGDLSLLSRNADNFQAFLTNYNANSNGPSKSISTNAMIASSTWSLVGPLGAMTGSAVNGLPRKAGRDNFITFHPTASVTNTYWSGTPAGGLWKTTNNGASWSTTTDLLNVIGCSDLAIDPTNPNRMFLATGDGDAGDCNSIGVLTSTNGGLTWTSTGLTFNVSSNFRIRRLIMNPSNTQILMAATNAGIYRTTNGGTSWTQVSTANMYDLEFKPGDPNTVYAGGTAFYLSTSAGASFTMMAAGTPTSGCNRMAVAITNNSVGVNYVYVVASNSSSSGLLGVYRSINSGVTFSTMATSPDLLANSCAGTGSGGQGWYDLAIAASPLNADEVVVGGVNHWRSTNGGSTWTNIGCWNSTVSNPPYVHADVHELEYSPTGVLYSANDGGTSEYTGSAWIDRTPTGTRNISQIYRIGLSGLSASLWITGHQDNGSNIYNGTTYNASYPGDGLDCFIDRTNNSNMFTETPYGGLVKSTNGGASWSSATSGITESSNWLCPWKQDPQTANTLYAGYNNIWKSTNLGTSWTSLAPLTTTAGSVVEFAIAPTNSLVMYVLKSSGVFKTTNGGTSWSNVTGTIPVGSAAPTYVAIDAGDPNTAWVTLSGYSSGNKVYMTTNGGTSWSNVSSNLPNLPANCIVYEPGTNDRVYVGMDVGVYYKDNSSTNWTLYNTGLPNVIISDLEISPAASGKLRAATYGRGVYEVDVVPCTSGPTVSVNSQTICTGASATLAASGASTYVWSTGGTSASIVVSPTLTTVYTVTGSAASCTDVKTATVTVISAPLLTVTPSSTVVCAGGSATLNASGAATFTWSTGLQAASIVVTPTAAAVYTVTGSVGTCTANKTATVLLSPLPSLSVSPNQTICVGSCITLTASGATAYTWSPGAITSASVSVCPTLSTTYTLYGNNGSCSASKTVQVTVGSALALTVSPNTTLCPATCATLVAGGAATSYTWQPGGNTGSVSVVCPTAAIVYTVFGSNGSCSNTKTVSVVPGSSLTISVNSLVLCSGSSGTLTATGAASYTWSTGSTNTAIVVSPGTTTSYTVIGSNGSCTGSKIVTVTVTPTPTISLSAAPATTVCAGNTLTLTATGGCSYTWMPSALFGTSIVVSPSASIIYTVITNCSGCIGSRTLAITALASPSLSASSTHTGVLCSGNSATLSASGATSYTWSTGALVNNIVVSPTTSVTYTVSGSNGGCVGTKTIGLTVSSVSLNICGSTTLCAGTSIVLPVCGAMTYSYSSGSSTVSPGSNATYTVAGTNSLGCTGLITVPVTVVAAPTLAIISTPSLSASSVTICSGNTAILTASGANTYSWNTGANTSSIAASPSVNTTYQVSGTNSSGCIGSNTVAVVVVPGASSLTLSASGTSVCAGGMATLSVNGAATYTWSTGSNASVVVISPSVTSTYSVTGGSGSCTANGAITISVTPNPSVSVNNQTICPGGTAVLSASGASGYTWSTGANSSSISVSPTAFTIYTVTGANANCVNSKTVSVTVGSSLSLLLNVSPLSVCAGGSATISATGATSYTWSNGSNAASIVVSPTAASSYSVIGQSGSCTGTALTSVSISPGPTVTILANPSGTLCSGASATLTASGAGSYSWSTGATGNSIIVSPTSNTVYNVVGSNAGCTATASVAVASGGGSLTLSANANPASICSGGSTTLSASGAGTYTWSNGSNASAIVVSPTITTTYSVSGASGSCLGNKVITVTVGLASPITVSAQPSFTVCAGKSITLTASGVYASYVWTSPTVTGSSLVVTPTANATYTVFASGGSSGCSTNTVVSISLGGNPVSIITTTNAGCNSACSGAIQATTSGGIAPYTYSLSGSTCTALPCNNICPGLYTLYTFDQIGCSSFNILSITSSPNNLLANVTVTNATCPTCNNGVLMANPSGGATPYTFIWAPSGGTAAIAAGLTPGCYTVTIADSQGCQNTSSGCVGISVGLNAEVVSESELLVFPNPAQDIVTVQYKGMRFQVALYNNLGQLVWYKTNGEDSTSLNTTEFAKGIYLLEVRISDTVYRKKLILD